MLSHGQDIVEAYNLFDSFVVCSFNSHHLITSSSMSVQADSLVWDSMSEQYSDVRLYLSSVARQSYLSVHHMKVVLLSSADLVKDHLICGNA